MVRGGRRPAPGFKLGHAIPPGGWAASAKALAASRISKHFATQAGIQLEKGTTKVTPRASSQIPVPREAGNPSNRSDGSLPSLSPVFRAWLDNRAQSTPTTPGGIGVWIRSAG
jgi:hypothetical protein